MWPEIKSRGEAQSPRGLCMPSSSELRRIPEYFDQRTFEIFDHEFLHVGATIGLYDDFETGVEYVLMVTGVANRDENYVGLTVVSNIIDEEKIAGIAAAGLLEPAGSQSSLGGADRLQVAEISKEISGKADVEAYKAKAQQALDRAEEAGFTAAIRIKMAEMATYLQRVHRFPLITTRMLRTMYAQAVQEVESEAQGFTPNNIVMWDTIPFAEYKMEADKLSRKYTEHRAQGLNGIDIMTVYRVPESTMTVCPTCGQKTLNASSAHQGCN